MEHLFRPAAAYSNELGSTLSDPYHPGLDYGNVPYARRESRCCQFLYTLPVGKGQASLNSNSVLDKVVGGWQLGGLLLFQSGPFMSTSVSERSVRHRLQHLRQSVCNRRPCRHGARGEPLCRDKPCITGAVPTTSIQPPSPIRARTLARMGPRSGGLVTRHQAPSSDLARNRYRYR